MNASLARWQRQFMQGILARGLPGLVHSGGAASAQRSFDIYSNAYRARLIDALRANYPVLHRALGDDAFESLALAYIEAHPSSYANIRWFGDLLETFARKRDDLVAHPALTDLIRLEWTLRGAFDAPERALLDAAALAGIAQEQWPDLILELHPSVRLIELDWQVEALWHSARAKAEEDSEAPLPGCHLTLVWRQGLNTRFRSLETSEADLLLGLVDAERFGQICERAAKYAADDATELAVGFLQRWLEDGLLAGAGSIPRTKA